MNPVPGTPKLSPARILGGKGGRSPPPRRDSPICGAGFCFGSLLNPKRGRNGPRMTQYDHLTRLIGSE